MGKPSRKAKANFPGKVSYVIKKERSNDNYERIVSYT